MIPSLDLTPFCLSTHTGMPIAGGEGVVAAGMSGVGAITFGGINENNLEQLRLLNETIFPVRYNDKFYDDILHMLPEFTKYGKSYLTNRISCWGKHANDDALDSTLHYTYTQLIGMALW